MNKRYLHHIWTRIRPIKTWYLLTLFLISAVICVFALRGNNLNMIKLRNDVYTADKTNSNVELALENLRDYVAVHMNTSLTDSAGGVYPPIQLKYTYQRLEEVAQAQVAPQGSQLYTNAENYCQQFDSTSFSGRSRVPCVENYVSTHGVHAQKISPNLYEFDFVSARWSPDLAGWSLVVSILLLFLTIVRFVLGYWLEKNT